MKQQPNTSSKIAMVTAATKIQAWFRGRVSFAHTKKLLASLFKRKKIVEELVLTEENYIRDLGMIVSEFKMTMISKKVISKA